MTIAIRCLLSWLSSKALIRQLKETRGSRGVSLMFFGVGKLSIRGGKVRFTFFREFLEEPAALVGNSQGWDFAKHSQPRLGTSSANA